MSGKTKHIKSYNDIEHVFMACFPELVLTEVKAVHRVYCQPKHGTVLVELKNGIGIRFSVESVDNYESKQKVKIFYQSSLVPAKYMPECLDYVEKRLYVRSHRLNTSGLKAPKFLECEWSENDGVA